MLESTVPGIIECFSLGELSDFLAVAVLNDLVDKSLRVRRSDAELCFTEGTHGSRKKQAV
jgi:hypothetical protein